MNHWFGRIESHNHIATSVVVSHQLKAMSKYSEVKNELLFTGSYTSIVVSYQLKAISTYPIEKHGLLLIGYKKSDLSAKIKRVFFQAMWTRLYGCTAWILTKRLVKKLDGNNTRMFWGRSSTLQNRSCTTTYLPSCKL